MAKTDFDGFMGSIASIIDAAHGVRVGALLIGPNSDRRILKARVVFLPGPTREFQEDLPLTVIGQFAAISVTLGRQRIPTVLKHLRDFRVDFGGGPSGAVPFPAKNGTPAWWTHSTAEREFIARDLHLNWPAHAGYVEGQLPSGLMTDEAISAFREHLPLATPPFADAEDLCRYLGVAEWGGYAGTSSPLLQVVAPVGVRLRGSDRDAPRSTLSVYVEQWGRLAGGAIASVIARGGKRTERHKLEMKDARRVPGQPGLRVLRVPLPGNEAPIEVVLSRDSRTLDRMRAGGASARSIIHEAFDPACNTLKRLLFESEAPSPHKRRRTAGARPPQDKFARGVAWLFHLLGFSVVDYDSLGPVPDVIALEPTGSMVLFIECSIQSSDRKKRRDLLHRTSIANEALDRNRHGNPVLPLAASPTEASLGDIELAEQEGVLLLSRKRLERLVEFLETGAAHQRTIAVLEDWAKGLSGRDPFETSKKLSERIMRGMSSS